MLENFPVIYTIHISIPLVSIFEVRALFNLNVAGKRHKIQELKLIYFISGSYVEKNCGRRHFLKRLSWWWTTRKPWKRVYLTLGLRYSSTEQTLFGAYFRQLQIVRKLIVISSIWSGYASCVLLHHFPASNKVYIKSADAKHRWFLVDRFDSMISELVNHNTPVYCISRFSISYAMQLKIAIN